MNQLKHSILRIVALLTLAGALAACGGGGGDAPATPQAKPKTTISGNA